jgi:hypothetical protein
LNPREACTPDGFRDRSIRPLWHPSVVEGYRSLDQLIVGFIATKILLNFSIEEQMPFHCMHESSRVFEGSSNYV